MGQTSRSKCFTTLDYALRYHQLRIADENSWHYTAFVTLDGHYDCMRIQVEVTNAPAVFPKSNQFDVYGVNRKNAVVNIEKRAKAMKNRDERSRIDAIQYKVGDIWYWSSELP